MWGKGVSARLVRMHQFIYNLGCMRLFRCYKSMIRMQITFLWPLAFLFFATSAAYTVAAAAAADGGGGGAAAAASSSSSSSSF